MIKVPATPTEIRGLLMLRNEMAHYTSRPRIRQDRSAPDQRRAASAPGVGDRIAMPSFLSNGRDLYNERTEQTNISAYEDNEFAHLDVDFFEPGHFTGTASVPDIEQMPFLPPTIDKVRDCGQCFASDACMLYRRVSSA
jgi:hypothetical protein